MSEDEININEILKGKDEKKIVDKKTKVKPK